VVFDAIGLAIAIGIAIGILFVGCIAVYMCVYVDYANAILIVIRVCLNGLVCAFVLAVMFVSSSNDDDDDGRTGVVLVNAEHWWS